jgi:hypothetical protein
VNLALFRVSTLWRVEHHYGRGRRGVKRILSQEEEYEITGINLEVLPGKHVSISFSFVELSLCYHGDKRSSRMYTHGVHTFHKCVLGDVCIIHCPLCSFITDTTLFLQS